MKVIKLLELLNFNEQELKPTKEIMRMAVKGDKELLNVKDIAYYVDRDSKSLKKQGYGVETFVPILFYYSDAVEGKEGRHSSTRDQHYIDLLNIPNIEDARDSTGTNLLHSMAKYGNEDVQKKLLTKRGLGKLNDVGYSPLQRLAEYAVDKEIFEGALKHLEKLTDQDEAVSALQNFCNSTYTEDFLEEILNNKFIDKAQIKNREIHRGYSPLHTLGEMLGDSVGHNRKKEFPTENDKLILLHPSFMTVKSDDGETPFDVFLSNFNAQKKKQYYTDLIQDLKIKDRISKSKEIEKDIQTDWE